MTHVLDVPFAMRGVANANQARWDAAHGVFVYEGRALPAALAPFSALPYSWEMLVQRELAGQPRSRPSAAAGTIDRIELRPHQTAAVRAIAAARAAGLPGFLLADDVGLGKTITAWEADPRHG